MRAEQFDELPWEESRYWELLDGELIEVPSPKPRHNLIAFALMRRIGAFARARRLGTVIFETDLAVSANTRLRPDIALFSAEKWESIDIDAVPVASAPDIVIEVLSPSETQRRMRCKIDAYLAWGVSEIWIIDPDARTLEIHRRDGSQSLTEGSWLTTESIPGWRIQVSEIFEDAA